MAQLTEKQINALAWNRAVASLLPPNTGFSVSSGDYDSLVIPDNTIEKPTEEVVLAAVDAQLDIINNKQYQNLRAGEYPPVEDYLDAIVKGDEAQKQAYIDACLAVKEKYPKP